MAGSLLPWGYMMETNKKTKVTRIHRFKPKTTKVKNAKVKVEQTKAKDTRMQLKEEKIVRYLAEKYGFHPETILKIGRMLEPKCKFYLNGKCRNIKRNREFSECSVFYGVCAKSGKLIQLLEEEIKNRSIEQSRKLKEEKKKTRKKKKQKDQENVVSNSELSEQKIKVTKDPVERLAKEYSLKSGTVQNIVGYVQNSCEDRNGKQCARLGVRCSILETKCKRYSLMLNNLKAQGDKATKHAVKSINISSTEDKNIKPEMPPIAPKETKNTQQAIKDINELPEIGLKDFVVRRAVFKCVHSNHQVKDIEAAIGMDDDGKKKLIRVVAGYCEQCKTYFILDSTYENLRKKGIILCRIWDEKSYTHNDYTNGMRLAQESILMQFGYNVSQQEGLSATSRQKILAVLIDNKVMTKNEIISYLDFFISQRSKQSSMELAISKWEADREFVEQYRAGEYTQYGVNAIHRRR